jgi:hypothetical protein
MLAQLLGGRRDRQFVAVLLDTLKVDRPVYQKLHTYVIAEGRPRWT